MSIKTLRQISGIVYDKGAQHIELELACGMYIITQMSDKQHDKLYADFGKQPVANHDLMRLEPQTEVYGAFEEGRAHGLRDLAPRLIWSGNLKDVEFLRRQFGPFDIDEGPKDQHENQSGLVGLMAALNRKEVMHQ